MSIIQKNRTMAFAVTGLGDDVLGLRSFSVEEQLGRLFTIEVELSSEDRKINFDDVVGHDACISLVVAHGEKRYFSGVVSRFVQVADQNGYAHYRATLVPWLWLLTRTSDCRVFQQKSVPDIIEAVFQGHGFTDFKLKLSGPHNPKEFCVQYRETDFNFVSRLMEQEGIYYYFEHENKKHTLVLADAISAHSPYPGYADVTFFDLKQSEADREAITDWIMEKEVQPVAAALQDFDFKKPKTSLLASTNVSRNYGQAKFEIYDYPGEYSEHGDGAQLADVRLEELQSQYETLRGQATARGLAAGYLFNLKKHPRAEQNRQYLLTGVALQADAGEFASEASSGGPFFTCRLTAIDKTQQFRAPRLTPKPIVQGPQTAIVVGPAGEEIYTDQHARVKVHFHWDRHDQSDENSSCWVRVSQYWAGKAWGTMHIPRLGQEVIVEFLEGDPDRPIITGRVYNADQIPPYDLPANKTQSGIKSRSSKGGGPANFNEIRMEDKLGSEMLTIHAEKDQNIAVEHDESHVVGHDRTKEIDHDETTHVKHDRTETVDHNETISIGKNRTETVGGDESIAITGSRTESVDKDESITISGARTTDITKAETISVGDARTETVEKDETITLNKNRAVTIKENDEQNIGKKFALIAGEQIQFQTGDASITLKKDGTIEIKGKDIKITGSGKINIKADSDIVIKGSSTKVN